MSRCYRSFYGEVLVIISRRTFNYPFRATRCRACGHFAWTHPRTRAILCVFLPWTRLSPVTDGDSCEDDYMVSVPYDEPGRIPRISFLHPVTTPWNSPKGVSRINARLSYWAINGPTLTLHRATGNTVHGPWNLWSSPRWLVCNYMLHYDFAALIAATLLLLAAVLIDTHFSGMTFQFFRILRETSRNVAFNNRTNLWAWYFTFFSLCEYIINYKLPTRIERSENKLVFKKWSSVWTLKETARRAVVLRHTRES